MHRQVRFMARSAASYGVAVLHNLSPGKHLRPICFFMDQIDLMDQMDKNVALVLCLSGALHGTQCREITGLIKKDFFPTCAD